MVNSPSVSFAESKQQAFASYDSDGNGVLDPVELEKFGADLLKLVQKSVQGPMFDKIVYKTVLKLETPDNFLQLCMKKLDKVRCSRFIFSIDSFLATFFGQINHYPLRMATGK